MIDWDWNKPVWEWKTLRVNDYFGWVKDSFGNEEMAKGFDHLNEYRAVMDVKQSVKPEPKESITDMLAHSMMHTKEVMAANLLKNHFEDFINESKQQKADATHG